MKPNLLSFSNFVLLSSEKRGAFNLNTGQLNPDTGYFVTLVEKPYIGVDKDLIREFWNENSDLLGQINVWLGVWWDGGTWVYAVGELVSDWDVAFHKAIARNSTIWDNEKNELIDLIDV